MGRKLATKALNCNPVLTRPCGWDVTRWRTDAWVAQQLREQQKKFLRVRRSGGQGAAELKRPPPRLPPGAHARLAVPDDIKAVQSRPRVVPAVPVVAYVGACPSRKLVHRRSC